MTRFLHKVRVVFKNLPWQSLSSLTTWLFSNSWLHWYTYLDTWFQYASMLSVYIFRYLGYVHVGMWFVLTQILSDVYFDARYIRVPIFGHIFLDSVVSRQGLSHVTSDDWRLARSDEVSSCCMSPPQLWVEKPRPEDPQADVSVRWAVSR